MHRQAEHRPSPMEESQIPKQGMIPIAMLQKLCQARMEDCSVRASSQHFSRALRQLRARCADRTANFSGLGLRQRSAAVLRECFASYGSSFQSINLRDNPLGDEGVHKIVEALRETGQHFARVDVQSTALSPRGTAAVLPSLLCLCDELLLSALSNSAYSNAVRGMEVAEAFASHLPTQACRVSLLALERVGLDDDALCGIARGIQQGGDELSLKRLLIAGNPVGASSIKELASAIEVVTGSTAEEDFDAAASDRARGGVDELHLVALSGAGAAQGMRHLIPALRPLGSRISVLRIEYTGLKNDFVTQLADVLGNNRFLRVLSLTGNQITGGIALRSLGRACKANCTLKELDLSHNRIGNSGMFEFVEGVRGGCSLEVLRCNSAGIEDAGAVAIADLLGADGRLRSLSLARNHIRNRGVTAISARLASDISLRILDVAANKFTQSGLEMLQQVILAGGRGPCLEKIALGGNDIPLRLANDIAQSLASNPRLTSAATLRATRMYAEIEDLLVEKRGIESEIGEELAHLERIKDDSAAVSRDTAHEMRTAKDELRDLSCLLCAKKEAVDELRVQYETLRADVDEERKSMIVEKESLALELEAVRAKVTEAEQVHQRRLQALESRIEEVRETNRGLQSRCAELGAGSRRSVAASERDREKSTSEARNPLRAVRKSSPVPQQAQVSSGTTVFSNQSGREGDKTTNRRSRRGRATQGTPSRSPDARHSVQVRTATRRQTTTPGAPLSRSQQALSGSQTPRSVRDENERMRRKNRVRPQPRRPSEVGEKQGEKSLGGSRSARRGRTRALQGKQLSFPGAALTNPNPTAPPAALRAPTAARPPAVHHAVHHAAPALPIPHRTAMKHVSPTQEITEERKRAEGIDLHALTCLFHGGARALAVRQKLERAVESDELLRTRCDGSLSHEEHYRVCLRKAARVRQLAEEMKLDGEDYLLLRHVTGTVMGTDLHESMFTHVLSIMSTPEQRAHWMPRARAYEIIGCYAQTELGHGSNVRGLETEAVLDRESDSWIVHSPSITATKWWPGGLGRTSNVALVFAQLVVDGKRLAVGPQPILVPLRDRTTHEPLPGVRVGELGPKMGQGGYNGNDNGFLRLDHVRVPREHLLMGVVTVARDGAVSVNKEREKEVYLTMMRIRMWLPGYAGESIAKAATIATRYAAVRRQFPGSDASDEEMKLLDIPIHYNRLLSAIAAGMMLRIAGHTAVGVLRDATARKIPLGEAHAIASALKGFCTVQGLHFIEDCRRCCGGNGYLVSSGFPELYTVFLPAATYEGDNTVMAQQAVRFLFKSLRAAAAAAAAGAGGDARRAAVPPAARFLLAAADTAPPLACSAAALALVIDAFATRITKRAAQRLLREMRAARGDKLRAWNACVPGMLAVSDAFAMAYVVRTVQRAVRDAALQPSERAAHILDQLLCVFMLDYIEREAANMMCVGVLEPSALHQVRAWREELCSALRPVAVPIVDSFAFSDVFLASTIGRYDGNVYESLVRTAEKAPLNVADLNPAILDMKQQIRAKL